MESLTWCRLGAACGAPKSRGGGKETIKLLSAPLSMLINDSWRTIDRRPPQRKRCVGNIGRLSALTSQMMSSMLIFVCREELDEKRAKIHGVLIARR